MGDRKAASEAAGADAVAQGIGRRLALARALTGTSRRQLAARLGLSTEQIRKYELGLSGLAVGRLAEIANTLGLSLGWFFREEPLPHDPALNAGLAEPSFGFVFDPPRRSAAPPSPPAIDRRETLELVRAFTAIADPELRRALLELVRAVSAAHAEASAKTRSTA